MPEPPPGVFPRAEIVVLIGVVLDEDGVGTLLDMTGVVEEAIPCVEVVSTAVMDVELKPAREDTLEEVVSEDRLVGLAEDAIPSPGVGGEPPHKLVTILKLYVQYAKNSYY